MYLLLGFTNQDLKSQFNHAWCIIYDYANDGQSKLGFKQGFSLKMYNNNTINNKEVHIYKHIYIYKDFLTMNIQSHFDPIFRDFLQKANMFDDLDSSK